MKVKDLIELLRKENPDLEVLFDDEEYGPAGVEISNGLTQNTYFPQCEGNVLWLQTSYLSLTDLKKGFSHD